MQTQPKLCKLFTLLILIHFNYTKLSAQSTDAGATGNIRGPLKFLGWNGTGLFPGFLNVRNDFNFPINFSTGPAQNERLRLWHRGPGPLLPNFPLSAPNPFPGNRLTRVAIPVDGAAPIGVPLAALHIGYGAPTSVFAQQAGFRDWMNVGTIYFEGSDNLYVGLREKTTAAIDPTGRTSTVAVAQTDDQDAVIAWGDNNQTPSFTPNNLTFIFNSIRTNANPNYQFTNYGREVARMTPEGHVGIGPVFFDNAQPQNLLHINNDLTNAAYLQISNAGATGQTATDGFQLGITAGPMAGAGGIAEIKHLEDKDIRFYTNNTFRMVVKDAVNGFGRIGINNLTPGNRLTVTSTAADPGAGSIASLGGSSGIRTSNMTSNSPTLPNPGAGVLSVNSVGDIIYVTSPTVSPGSSLGNICGLGSNPLLNSWEIPLNGNNFLFEGNGAGTGVNNLGVGVTCAPLAKLHVQQSSGSNLGSTGIFVENTDVNNCGAGPVIGIKSLCSNTALNDLKVAGWFESAMAPNCFGSIWNYAIIVPQNGGLTELGYAPTNINNLGNYLLDVNGTINCVNIAFNSDASLKNSVTTLPNSLNMIKKLRPVTFKWNTITDSVTSGIHAGFIAQEVDTVIPQLVRTGAAGKKSVAYTEMIPYLVSAMQELIKQNKQQDSIIQVLTQNVASCCSNSNARITGIQGNDPKALNQIHVNLSDVDMIVLNQNVPNPFAEQTTITYNVPEKYGFAQLVFKTVDGKIIKTVDITKKGRGQVNVYANDLTNGLYMYTLIVDGMTIDTKKMVKQ